MHLGRNVRDPIVRSPIGPPFDGGCGNFRLNPGMTATAEINVGKWTVISYLLQSLREP